VSEHSTVTKVQIESLFSPFSYEQNIFFLIPYFLFLKDNNRDVYYPGDVHRNEQIFLALARYGSQPVVKDCDAKASKHLIFRKVA